MIYSPAMQAILLRAASLVLAAALLAACGSKGPLYLPPSAQPPSDKPQR